MSKGDNPLKKFYRVPKAFVRLPSRAKFYESGVVELNADGEVPVLPMTAGDEIILKNPDALLSGQAILDVLKSCIPAVKKPLKLLSCDVDALMIGIRKASYGDESTTSTICPSCNHENTYSIDLDYLLNTTKEIQEIYKVEFEDNLVIFVRPGTFESAVRRQKAWLENRRIQSTLIDDDRPESVKLKALSDLIQRVSKLNYELVLDGIHRVEIYEDDSDGPVIVENREHIADYLHNVERDIVDKISDVIIQANTVGIDRTVPATCTECGHTWDANLEFNPVNFSSGT